MNDRPHVLWGLTASVAAIRAANLAVALRPLGDVRAVATERTRHFLADFPSDIELLTDADEWSQWQRLGDPVLHIELRRWADVLVIAPLSADSLAKLAHGLCDNLLLSVARAWEFPKPIVLAPAMNTLMWYHPFTAQHLATLQDLGMTIVEPVTKELACQDVGVGALAAPDAISAAVAAALAQRPPR